MAARAGALRAVRVRGSNLCFTIVKVNDTLISGRAHHMVPTRPSLNADRKRREKPGSETMIKERGRKCRHEGWNAAWRQRSHGPGVALCRTAAKAREKRERDYARDRHRSTEKCLIRSRLPDDGAIAGALVSISQAGKSVSTKFLTMVGLMGAHVKVRGSLINHHIREFASVRRCRAVQDVFCGGDNQCI